MRKLLQLKLALKTWAIIRRYQPRAVAVTGSVGKSTTKDAVALALQAGFKLRATQGNYNNEIGVPLTVLGAPSGPRSFFRWLSILLSAEKMIIKKIHDYPEVLVLEFGADRPGDIGWLCRLVPPSVGVVTAVSAVHTKFFGSIKAVAQEKGRLIKALPANGTAVLNADEPPVLDMRPDTKARVVTYGFAPAADYRIVEARFNNELSEHDRVGLQAVFSARGQEFSAIFPKVVAEYQLGSVAAALAVAESLGVPANDALEKLKEFSPPPGRTQLIPGIKGSWILDDSYNSSPLAAQRAVETLGKIPGAKQRLAVLGEMAELGALTVAAHEELGRQAAQAADYLVGVGEPARHIIHGALKAGLPEERTAFFSDNLSAGKFVQNKLRPGDLVLVKGSQVARLERVVKELMAEPERAAELLVRQGPEWLNK